MKMTMTEFKTLLRNYFGGAIHITRADLDKIKVAQETGDWSAVQASKLYNEHGGEYCAALEVLNKLDNESEVL